MNSVFNIPLALLRVMTIHMARCSLQPKDHSIISITAAPNIETQENFLDCPQADLPI
jgi:hypothetical protein